MAFEFLVLDSGEADQLAARVVGPVFSLSRECAADRAADTFLIALGSIPNEDPSDHGSTSFYNMMRGAEVFDADGYYKAEKEGSGWVIHYALAIRMPQAWAGRVEEARLLMEEGLRVFQSGVRESQQAVRLSFSRVSYR